ncbi:MAG: Fe-S cluster assembly protein SufB [Bacilli bacterium]|nr:Fe-S cluster assembly protein SufB [Bacilli bacterium]
MKTDITKYEDKKIKNIYNMKVEEKGLPTKLGLNKKIVESISMEKNEPKWVLDIRLKALDLYNKLELPTWGPDLSELDIDSIYTYVGSNTKMNESWEEVPDDIKNVFDALGIPEAEKKSLGGVGAQFDSEMVYHKISDELSKKGVIYTNFDTAIKEYPDLVKQYFTKCVPISDHKFIALHYALFSGGSFVYVPKGVKLDTPLQSYFRLNAKGAGQFEHTLIIVEDEASLQFIEGCSAPGYNELNLHAGCVELFVKNNGFLRFSTIENWSKNMMNLNTKKAIVGKNSRIEWIMGSFGSKISMLYPLTVLSDNSTCEFTGISFAGKGQNLDTGLKVIHNGSNTSTVVNSKSISKDGGICTFRSNAWVKKNATNSKLTISCDSLMMDSISRSDTIPVNHLETNDVIFSHEAKIGKISDEEIFYLMSRGLSEQDAKALIVRGFAEPIAASFPIEYAVEMNRLIDLELEGAIG